SSSSCSSLSSSSSGSSIHVLDGRDILSPLFYRSFSLVPLSIESVFLPLSRPLPSIPIPLLLFGNLNMLIALSPLHWLIPQCFPLCFYLLQQHSDLRIFLSNDCNLLVQLSLFLRRTSLVPIHLNI
ncbi:hypothetical protein PMAYCL1PPCAC_29121, partial [Pristionchus mayeri]